MVFNTCESEPDFPNLDPGYIFKQISIEKGFEFGVCNLVDVISFLLLKYGEVLAKISHLTLSDLTDR